LKQLNKLGRLAKALAPAYVCFALLAPTVIIAFNPSLFWHKFAWLDARLSGVDWNLLDLHRRLFSFGISTALVTLALTVFGCSAARRSVLIILSLLSIELFYGLAYKGSISPAILLTIAQSSPREAVELLSGHAALTGFLACVVALSFYVIATSWNNHASIAARPLIVLAGLSVLLIGTGIFTGRQEIKEVWRLRMVTVEEMKEIFPLDFVRSFAVLWSGAQEARHAAAKRENFSFPNVRRADSIMQTAHKEIYVVMVGESSRRSNWSLFGYPRQTTPRLGEIADKLFKFDRVTSNASITILSVPMALTRAGPEAFHVSRSEKSIVSLLKEAGFSTYWISNQEHFGPFANSTTSIANEADHVYFPEGADIAGENRNIDSNLLLKLDEALAATGGGDKIAVFIHMMGSHWYYSDRYPTTFGRFPDGSAEPRVVTARQKQIVAEYDNSVLFSDYIVRGVIDRLAQQDCDSGLIYFSDHGERLFDGGVSDDEMGHGFPSPSRKEIEVPLVVWLSDSYRRANPNQVAFLQRNTGSVAQLSSVFETIVDLAGAQYSDRNASLSLFSESYSPPQVLKILDPNEQVETLTVNDTH
jgi:glucan phosphoethanolaminetransferase (alkaline phosphatase superfamily)